METNKSNLLTQAESDFLRHMSRWGSDGYPIQKAGRKWFWTDFWGCKGSPIAYKTKREAATAIESYISLLGDKAAGRLS
jgi:hypothetical protein